MNPFLTFDSFAKTNGRSLTETSIARWGLYGLVAGTLILGTLALSGAFILAIVMNDPQWASPC